MKHAAVCLIDRKHIEKYQKTRPRNTSQSDKDDASCGSLAAASAGTLGGCGPGAKSDIETKLALKFCPNIRFGSPLNRD